MEILKFVSWNCQGAYRRKSDAIAAYMPDIAVIQECESPERLLVEIKFTKPTTFSWFGELKYKGLCIMSYTGYEFELHEAYDPSIEYCMPLKVKGHKNFNLIAVWTQNHQDKNTSYIGQVYKAIDFYKDFILEDDTVIIGDFNSNQIWDNERSIGNHSDVVNGLKSLDLVSIYHEMQNEDHGLESQPTFYMYRKVDKPFHIDYCFAPKSWASRLKRFEVGSFDKWCKLSDHCPITAEFQLFDGIVV